ncbi:MAG: sigma-70 family RNA polymerase sigma factor, partial [Acidobacteriota bacterium]
GVEDVTREVSQSRQALADQLEWTLGYAQRLGHRRGIPEAEEFAAWAICRLLARDGAILRACRNNQRIRPYLKSVIHNLLKDYRNRVWGKWRASATATKLGATAMELERLQGRDGFSLQEAISSLRFNHSCRESIEELEALAALLPQRHEQHHIPLDECSAHPILGSSQAWPHDYRARSQELVFKKLASALNCLDRRDAEILRSHYIGGKSLASIARQYDLNQRALYSRRDRCLRQLRRALEGDGLSWKAIVQALGIPTQAETSPNSPRRAFG